MSMLLAVAVCLSPLGLVWLGYMWGRYGLPVEIRRRQKTDRRIQEESTIDPASVEIQYE